MRYIKILLNIPNSYGSELMTSNLAMGLRRAGYDIVVEIDRSQISGKAYQLLQSNSIEMVELGLNSRKIKSLYRLIRFVIKERRCNLIISSLFRCDLYCFLLKIIWPGKILTIVQGNYYEGYKHHGFGLTALYLNLISVMFHKLIAISEYVNSNITRAIPSALKNRVMTIHNGVDIEEFYPIKSANKSTFWKSSPFDYVIGLAGRLHKGKNPKLLFHLADILLEIGRGKFSFLFVLIGDGEERADLERYAQEKGYLSKFVFTGFVADMNQAYNNLDFLVHFHSDEGFGLVIAEAMACEVVPLAFNGSAINEIIEPGVDGFLVETIEEMAIAIKSLTESPSRIRVMAEAARRKISEKFTLGQQVQKYCQVISELAKSEF